MRIMHTQTTHHNRPLRPLIESSADLLDDKAAAAVLDVSPGTLSVWRSTGRYALPFLKIGRKVRYRRADLLAWMDKRTRECGATA
jgi:predicted DNA-binding transcriptional regulator AlpA